MELLYTDRRIVVCVKPAGVVSTDEPGGVPELVRRELGDPAACVRTVHRLDQVVGGVMVLARSVRAARELTAQIQGRTFGKEYLAVVHGTPPAPAGTFTDLLIRDRRLRRTLVTHQPGPDAREAVLDYETLCVRDGLALVRIRLHTGRTHQIRAQFSARGLPLAGDRKYGAPEDDCPVALWSHALSFRHPETDEPLSFTCPPPVSVPPWDRFAGALPH